jgi:hypothetical protein
MGSLQPREPSCKIRRLQTLVSAVRSRLHSHHPRSFQKAFQKDWKVPSYFRQTFLPAVLGSLLCLTFDLLWKEGIRLIPQQKVDG